MDNCTICDKPLTKKGILKGRTEHFGCRMVKRVAKKIYYGVDEDSQHFEKACKTLDKNPELLLKKF